MMVHLDLCAEAYHVGVDHGRYAARILEFTAPSRRAALTESATIRCRRIVAATIPTDAPGAEILAHAEAGFDDAIQAHNHQLEKEHR